ncbi:hypothetical protein [Stackebrandtia soli]|uniref:hypothetical protein n=1 Tax=Stackebrandtia soli TaxID=1892856 RepID=UPI0039EB094E
MTNYDPYSPFGSQQPDKSDKKPDQDSGNSVGEQYSFDGPGYQPAPQDTSWPSHQTPHGMSPTQPGSYPPPPPNYPVSAQPVTGQPMSGQPMSPGWQHPTSPTQQPMMPPAYQAPRPPQSDTSFMSAGRVWATVGIVVGIIVVVFVLICALGWAGAARY